MFSAQNERTIFMATLYTAPPDNDPLLTTACIHFTFCISGSLLEHFYRTSNRNNGTARMIAWIKPAETLFGGETWGKETIGETKK